MKKKEKVKPRNIDLYDFDDGQVDEEKISKKNQLKINKKNLKTKKKITKKVKKKKNVSDTEDDIAISMTNKNRIKKEQEKRKKNTKQTKKSKLLKKIIRRICITILLILLLIGGIAFLLTSQVFNIKQIEVLGANILTSQKVINLSGIQLENNTFQINKIRAVYNIEQNSYVKSANIIRELPDIVKIVIEERVPKFVLEVEGEYIYIDESTYILERNCDNSLGLITITGSHTNEEELIEGKQLSIEDIDIFNEIYEILNIASQYDLINNITSIDISDKNEYYFNMKNDLMDVYLGDNTNVGTKMMYIVAIMAENQGNSGTIYVNGDFNNNFRAYFRKDV